MVKISRKEINRRENKIRNTIQMYWNKPNQYLELTTIQISLTGFKSYNEDNNLHSQLRNQIAQI